MVAGAAEELAAWVVVELAGRDSDDETSVLPRALAGAAAEESVEADVVELPTTPNCTFWHVLPHF